MATSNQDSNDSGLAFIVLVFALMIIISAAGGCGGSHSGSSSRSSSKYTKEQLEDAHRLYEIREQMIEDM